MPRKEFGHSAPFSVGHPGKDYASRYGGQLAPLERPRLKVPRSRVRPAYRAVTSVGPCLRLRRGLFAEAAGFVIWTNVATTELTALKLNPVLPSPKIEIELAGLMPLGVTYHEITCDDKIVG